MSALRPCTEMQTESSREFLKSCDMSHSVVIASISDVLIPECIILSKATQHMLDLKVVYYYPPVA